jgi:hypothetical protein
VKYAAAYRVLPILGFVIAKHETQKPDLIRRAAGQPVRVVFVRGNVVDKVSINGQCVLNRAAALVP